MFYFKFEVWSFPCGLRWLNAWTFVYDEMFWNLEVKDFPSNCGLRVIITILLLIGNFVFIHCLLLCLIIHHKVMDHILFSALLHKRNSTRLSGASGWRRFQLRPWLSLSSKGRRPSPPSKSRVDGSHGNSKAVTKEQREAWVKVMGRKGLCL